MLLVSGTGSQELAAGNKPPDCCTTALAKNMALRLPSIGSYIGTMGMRFEACQDIVPLGATRSLK